VQAFRSLLCSDLNEQNHHSRSSSSYSSRRVARDWDIQDQSSHNHKRGVRVCERVRSAESDQLYMHIKKYVYKISYGDIFKLWTVGNAQRSSLSCTAWAETQICDWPCTPCVQPMTIKSRVRCVYCLAPLPPQPESWVLRMTQIYESSLTELCWSTVYAL